MMTAFDLRQGIADRLKENVVCRDNFTLWSEFNNGHRCTNGTHPGFIFQAFLLGNCDIRCDFYNADYPAIDIVRNVGRFKLDRHAILPESLVLRLQRMPRSQLIPETKIVITSGFLLTDKESMMAADDVRLGVAKKLSKVFIAAEYHAIWIELDPSKRSINRDRQRIRQ